MPYCGSNNSLVSSRNHSFVRPPKSIPSSFTNSIRSFFLRSAFRADKQLSESAIKLFRRTCMEKNGSCMWDPTQLIYLKTNENNNHQWQGTYGWLIMNSGSVKSFLESLLHLPFCIRFYYSHLTPQRYQEWILTERESTGDKIIVTTGGRCAKSSCQHTLISLLATS